MKHEKGRKKQKANTKATNLNQISNFIKCKQTKRRRLSDNIKTKTKNPELYSCC